MARLRWISLGIGLGVLGVAALARESLRLDFGARRYRFADVLDERLDRALVVLDARIHALIDNVRATPFNLAGAVEGAPLVVETEITEVEV